MAGAEQKSETQNSRADEQERSMPKPIDPDVEIVRSLTGHRRLTAAQAHRRYEALIRVLAKDPARSRASIAREVGCSPANMSQLVLRAAAALGVRLDQAV